MVCKNLLKVARWLDWATGINRAGRQSETLDKPTERKSVVGKVSRGIEP